MLSRASLMPRHGGYPGIVLEWNEEVEQLNGKFAAIPGPNDKILRAI